MTCAKKKSNKILLQGRNKKQSKVTTRKCTQIGVEQIEDNVGFLPLFIATGHLIQGFFLKKFPPTCGSCSHMYTHVWPMSIYVRINSELWIN